MNPINGHAPKKNAPCVTNIVQYLYETNAIVLAILWAKLRLWSIIVTDVSLFGCVVYFSVDAHYWQYAPAIE